MGRRERKKAATRKALADAALELFLERGYDQVSIKDVAEAADVSTTTLFKHFSGKEALVFDEDAEVEAGLVAAVRERPAGLPIPAALRDYVLRVRIDAAADPRFASFLALVNGTPALREHAHRIWMRHETALAHAIAEDIGAPESDPTCAALAHFALETVNLARGQADPRRAVQHAFDLLERGWPAAATDRTHAG
ncbi:TetR/AcrR family transcriptional regulator [Kitasatospora aureofaciens]|uniref:TetR/AcrR family transcriptional regulator n=1 Tax=Kitasatospora aureofaciens TaxID=1894 RepID=UPI001C464D87|nr:TetR/AcrR family transcriptional regulator [Kitasatospora aureofaciens]MBV6702072.1 TetR/AcrR family transcriptional regulator [Kitasatospora aureofaciens]